jgi:hypothetical protein
MAAGGRGRTRAEQSRKRNMSDKTTAGLFLGNLSENGHGGREMRLCGVGDKVGGGVWFHHRTGDDGVKSRKHRPTG